MGLTAALLLVCLGCGDGHKAADAPIKIGILHSLTGSLAISEQSVADATMLAIEEVNAAGGLLGQPIEPVIADGRSDPQTFAREAERLIGEERVQAIFGCWTSASRKEVKVVVEARDHVLLYPLQYEGMEQSPNIVYLGATPNQQVVPATRWCLDHVGCQFFLVGSDYVFPHAANEVIREYLTYRQADIVGEAYIALGSDDVSAVVAEIVEAKPNIILNTVNGSTNVALFRALRKAGVTPDQTVTMSFSLGEAEIQAIGAETVAGDYAAWNYFQNLPGIENDQFIARFRDKYGASRTLTDPMESAYVGVHLWADAVRAAGTTDPRAVRKAIRNQSLDAPQGTVYVDNDNLHLWQRSRLGRIRPDGQFELVWQSQSVIHPVPYPVFRTKKEWRALLLRLYEGWGGQWSAPSPEKGG